MSTFLPSLAFLAIVAVWLHIYEEAARGFREYFNTQLTGRKYRPVDESEGFFKDQLGLGALLTWLIWMGTDHPWAAGIAAGILLADVWQHGLFSLVAGMRYTPGLGTCALYVYILWSAGWSPANPGLWPLVGVAFIAGNFLFALVRTGGRAS